MHERALKCGCKRWTTCFPKLLWRNAARLVLSAKLAKKESHKTKQTWRRLQHENFHKFEKQWNKRNWTLFISEISDDARNGLVFEKIFSDVFWFFKSFISKFELPVLKLNWNSVVKLTNNNIYRDLPVRKSFFFQNFLSRSFSIELSKKSIKNVWQEIVFHENYQQISTPPSKASLR